MTDFHKSIFQIAEGLPADPVEAIFSLAAEKNEVMEAATLRPQHLKRAVERMATQRAAAVVLRGQSGLLPIHRGQGLHG